MIDSSELAGLASRIREKAEADSEYVTGLVQSLVRIPSPSGGEEEAINLIKEHSVVVLVEQNFYMANEVGDYFYILDDGMVVHNGFMEELAKDDELKSRYLGISKTEV